MNQEVFNFAQEKAARDQALDLIEQHRGGLLATAKFVAEEINRRYGKVTSPEVLRAMRFHGYGKMLDEVDPRFMGAVFRSGWKRIGYEPGGSHCRPVSIWTKESA